MRPYELVTATEKLAAIAREIEQAEAIALDLETADPKGGGSVDPLTGRVRICSLNTGKNRYVIDLYETGTFGPLADALNRTNAVVIGQNLKFDQKWLLWHYGVELKKVFDTFRASHILYAGLPGLKHDLWSIYKRELDEAPSTEDLAASDWNGPLSKQQYDYAADDVDRLLRLREVMKAKLVRERLVKIAGLEFQALLPEAAIELNGLRLDAEMWKKRTMYDEARARALRATLLAELPNPIAQQGLDLGLPLNDFNIDSPDQVLKAFRMMGIKHKVKDPETGVTSVVPLSDTKEMTLAMCADKWPVLAKFIEYRGYAKNGSAFGTDFLKHLHPKTGRIHCSYHPYTDAGRYACVAPWTPVKTLEGIKPIADVRVGDKVWTHKERWRTVRAFLPQGTLQTYSVRFSTGDILTCSTNHLLLLPNGQWMTVGEMIRECVESVGQQPSEPAGSPLAVSQPGSAASDGHCREAGDDFSQRPSGRAALLAGSRAEGSSRASVLHPQAGRSQSHVGQERRGASQLDRRVRGWAWLPDLLVGGETALRTPSCDDGSLGPEGASRFDGGASHRRRPEEQQTGQPCACHGGWAPRRPLYAGEGQPVVTVEEIHPADRIEVYDLSVEEDESYETLGVFSHNCRSPNLQQIPRGKEFRECFHVEEGRMLAICDWSNIEMRLAAEISGDKKLIKVFNDDEDAHYVTAGLMTGKAKKDITKQERQQAKPVNFGFIYGMSAAKLVLYAKSSYGVTLSEGEAKKFRKAFFEGYSGIQSWHNYALDSGKRGGETRTLWGRRRIIKDAKAHNEFLNSPVQGSGADGLKNSLRVVYEKLKKLNGGGLPLLAKGANAAMVHMVHDEIIVEHKDTPELAEAAQQALHSGMIEGIAPMTPKVKCVAEVGGGKSWAAK